MLVLFLGWLPILTPVSANTTVAVRDTVWLPALTHRCDYSHCEGTEWFDAWPFVWVI